MDRTARSVSPSRGVVEPALLVGEPITRLEVREQVGQPDLGVRALDVGQGRPHRRLVGDAPCEQRAQALLGGEQAG